MIILLFVPLVFALPVGQGTKLSWTPPTTNNDGTAITNLSGYKIYWSTTSGNYTNVQSKDVGNVTTIPIVNVTGSNSVYYFVATAYNTSGNESGFSNEVRNTLPLGPAVPGILQVQP